MFVDFVYAKLWFVVLTDEVRLHRQFEVFFIVVADELAVGSGREMMGKASCRYHAFLAPHNRGLRSE